VVTLHAFLVRRPDLSHEEFLEHWRDRHAPLIRDTPELARHLVRYEQHARIPGGRGGTPGYDGVAVQVYRDWDGFAAMLDEPAAEAMAADEGRFLDRERLVVVFSEDVEVVVGDGATGV